jgi:hypothetical protein
LHCTPAEEAIAQAGGLSDMDAKKTGEYVERAVKMAGIVGGLAAALAVYVQLKDINARERDKTVDDWQNAAVYRIIETSPVPIRFQDIALRYTSEAQKFPAEIPRDKLDDPHLQLVLIRLLQNQAVIEPYPGVYSVRVSREVNPAELVAMTTKMENDRDRQFASHMQLAMEQLSQATAPLTPEQLQQRITAIGGDPVFLRENFPMILQQLSMQGELRFTGDGRVAHIERNDMTQSVVPPPDVSEVLPKLSHDLMWLILTNRPGAEFDQCYPERDPPDLQNGGLLKEAASLGLATVDDKKGMKGDDGRPCGHSIHVRLTNLAGKVWDYYFANLQLLMK